jgi:hypothetical protein
MRNVLFLIAVFSFVFSSAVWASDVSGTWTVKWQSPHGEDEAFDLLIEGTGGDLTITGTHPKLETLVGSGILRENAIIMNLKATGSMNVIVDFGGIVTGNKMSGTRVIMTAPGGHPGTAPAEGQEPADDGPGGAQGSVQGDAGGPPPGVQGGAPDGGEAPAGEQGSAPGAGPGGEPGQGSNAWTAEKK